MGKTGYEEMGKSKDPCCCGFFECIRSSICCCCRCSLAILKCLCVLIVIVLILGAIYLGMWLGTKAWLLDDTEWSLLLPQEYNGTTTIEQIDNGTLILSRPIDIRVRGDGTGFLGVKIHQIDFEDIGTDLVELVDVPEDCEMYFYDFAPQEDDIDVDEDGDTIVPMTLKYEISSDVCAAAKFHFNTDVIIHPSELYLNFWGVFPCGPGTTESILESVDISAPESFEI